MAVQRWIGKLVFLYVLMASVPGFAATLTAELDRVAGTPDDDFILTVTANGSVSGKLKTPEIPGVSVTELGTSRNFSIINGSINNEMSYRFGLSATKLGRYTVPSFELTVGGEKLKTLPIDFEVKASADGSQRGADLIVERTLDKTEVFVGEAVMATVRVYHKKPLLDVSAEVAPAPGVRRVEVEGQKNDRKALNGETYDVVELREIFIPVQAGSSTLPAFKVTALLQESSRGGGPTGMSPFFDSFFDRGKRVKRTAESAPAVLKVKEWPAGKPKDFSGIVGRFQLSATVGPENLKVGETATLTVTLDGEGDLAGAKLPLTFPMDQWKVYPDKPQFTETADPALGLVSKKIFQFALVPTAGGTLPLPPVALSVLNPATGKYETLEAQLPELKVAGAAPAAPPPVPVQAAPDKVDQAVASAPPAVASSLKQRWLFILIGFAAVAFVSWKVRARRRAASLDNAPLVAPGEAAARLQKDLGQLPREPEPAVSELSHLVRRYLTERFEVPPGVTAAELWRYSLPEKERMTTTRLLTELEHALYSGAAITSERVASLRAQAELLARDFR